MRPRYFFTLAACGLAVACGENGKAPLDVQNERIADFGADSSAGTTVQVSVLALTRDSTFRPVAEARVIFVRVGEVPPDSVPDSLPPPPPPPDSTPPSDSLTSPVARGGPPYGFYADSIPGDTTPPPPPPPPFTCGRDGTILARGRTNQFGVLTVTGLRSGKYDILVQPPRGSRLQPGGFCGLHLPPGQSAQVSVTLIR